MFDNIYRNKTVLVTGHTGFKGSWLSIWLRELGSKVLGFSLAPPSLPNIYDATDLRRVITHINGDIRDLDSLQATINEYQPEFLFHLAAQPLVRFSYDDPKITFDTNIGGTVNVLEAVRRTSSVRVLINVSSDKCYENREWLWGYRENDRLGGHDPYSASKAGAEIVFNAYQYSFFSSTSDHYYVKETSRPILGAASVRAGNVIGGGDWGHNRLIPDSIRALSQGYAIGVRNPHAIRPWQHVLEPLYGYLQLGTKLWYNPRKYSGSWNFGPNDVNLMTVDQLLDLLIDAWGSGSKENLSERYPFPEAVTLKLCCDKAASELNWRSILTTTEMISMTVDWYKYFYVDSPKGSLYDLCLSQIRDYMAKSFS